MIVTQEIAEDIGLSSGENPGTHYLIHWHRHLFPL